MSDVINSPNMNLPVPIVGQDPGPDWANNYNSCLSVIDGHNHASGSGVQINQSGINLIASATTFDSLGFNSSNAWGLRSIRFTPQSAPLSLSTDVGCLYESGVDLYYNDGNGVQIPITSGGAVNATSSGIANGTATASFVSGVLVVNENTNTPGNIKAGSVFIGNNTSGSDYVEVSAPNSLASNYPLLLPTIPSTQGFVTLDTSGQFAASTIAVANGITRSNLAAVGQQISSSSGAFFSSSTSPVAVTNLSVTITTSGRPVIVFLQPASSGTAQLGAASSNASYSAQTYMYIYRGASAIATSEIANSIGNSQLFVSPGCVFYLDAIAAGTYTYSIKTAVLNSTYVTSIVYYVVLVAYEL